MTLPVFQRTITDDKGNAVSGASVRVRHEMVGTPLAKLYSDRDGETPLGNPATTDSTGFIRFYVASGAYRIDVSFGTTTITWRHVAIGLAAEQAGIAPGITWRYSGETADQDPGAGFLHFDTEDVTQATAMYVSNNDDQGADQTNFLDSLDDGGSSGDRGTLIVQGENAIERVVLQVTDTVDEGGGSPPTYRKLSVTVLSANIGDLTVGGVFGLLFSQDAAAGGAIVLDLGDDGNNESTQLGEIATVNDTNDVFSEPSPDKLLIDLGNPVPFADLAAEAEDLAEGASVFDHLDFPEIADPLDESPQDLPPANTMRAYARDDGSGNTEMVLLDSAGHEVVIRKRHFLRPDGIVAQEVSAGTDGGSKASGDENAPLNTVQRDNGNFISLSSDEFTLDAGEYYMEFFSHVYNINGSQAYIRNATDGIAEILGSAEADDQNASCVSYGQGYVSISAQKTFQLRHYSTSSKSGDGFGRGSRHTGSPINTLWRAVYIWRLR